MLTGVTTEREAMPAEPEPVVRAAVPADAERGRRDLRALRHDQRGDLRGGRAHRGGLAAAARRADRAEPALPGGRGGRDGSVCGFAYASPWRPKPAYRHTVEDSVYLSADCTGRGIGSALLGTLLAGCAAAGARQVIAVIADTGSGASAALHRRFGFTQAGLLSGVGRKHGRWIDTLLMQKELEPTRPPSPPGSAPGRPAWASCGTW